MSREIKFRAWDGKKMVEVESIDFSSLTKICWFSADSRGEHPIQPLMQFTGLHDKNGKEIYEGDILKSNFPNRLDIPKNELHEVIFREASFESVGFSPKGYREKQLHQYWWSRSCEVVGSIYENPELLKEKKS